MNFNSIEFLIFFPGGVFVLLHHSAKGKISVLIVLQLFLLYVLESEICHSVICIHADYMDFRISSGENESDQG